MHWSRPGATAITALRSEGLNGHSHQLWAHLILTRGKHPTRAV